MMLLFNKNVFKILLIFAVSPGKSFSRGEIKSLLGISNVTLDNALSYLLNSEILIKKSRRFSLNFENENLEIIMDLVKKEYTKFKRLPLKILFILVDLGFIIGKKKGIDAYLFGSYSKLIFNEKSDIDIAIIGNVDGIMKELKVFSNKVKKKYGKIIEYHFFGKDFYKNKKDPFVKEILLDGIKIA